MTTTLEWLNQNSNRAFPFKENVSRVSGVVAIPNVLLVDMAFVVPAVNSSDEFYLKTLIVASTQITGIIATQASTNVGTFSIPLQSHTYGMGYPIIGAGDYTDARGRVTAGDLTDILLLIPEGIHNFTLDATLFEISAVRPDLRRVRGIRIQKADGTVSAPITGVVQLVSGTNVVLENPIAGTIKISAIGNDDFVDDCGDCLNQFKLPDPIRTINGVSGDIDGNITLVSTTPCLTVTPRAELSAVEFHDVCSQPCCGCAELEFVTTSLSTLRDSIVKLESIASTLQDKQNEFFQNVLSSL